MSEWVGEFVGGPLDGQRKEFPANVHTMILPMWDPSRAHLPQWYGHRPAINRGKYVRSNDLTGDGACWRMHWSPPA